MSVFRSVALAFAVAGPLSACMSAPDLGGLNLTAGRAFDFSSLPSSGHMVAANMGTTIPTQLLQQRMEAKNIGGPRGALVPYKGSEEPGTIVIEQSRQALYFVEADGKAMRYTVAVGAAQNQWTGLSRVTAVHLQPGWTAPPSLLRAGAGPGVVHESGSPSNPMGIGALTLSGGDYAIHGTNRPDSIGRAVSGGCFRMFNEDIADLMKRVRVGTKVVVNG